MNYSPEMFQVIQEEFPLLYDKDNPIVYLDHAGASLYSKGQIEKFYGEMSNNLYCNPHTNFGNLKVSYNLVALQRFYFKSKQWKKPWEAL